MDCRYDSDTFEDFLSAYKCACDRNKNSLIKNAKPLFVFCGIMIFTFFVSRIRAKFK